MLLTAVNKTGKYVCVNSVFFERLFRGGYLIYKYIHIDWFRWLFVLFWVKYASFSA